MTRHILGLVAGAVVVGGTAPAHAQGRLFGTEISGPDELIEIDPFTAAWSLIGPIDGTASMNGLAFDPNGNTLFGIDAGSDQLFEIDQSTGSATVIGGFGGAGFTNANGLAFDPNSGTLYATDNTTNSLFTIDTLTGEGTLVGPITGGFFTEIEGLAYDGGAGVLYGITDLQNALLVIDTDTAVASEIDVNLPADQWRGLTFDSDLGVLYATSVTPSLFYRVDPVGGTTTLVGELIGAQAVQGLAYKPIPGPGGLVLVLLGLPGTRRRHGGLASGAG